MAYSTRTMRPADWDEIRHFKPTEFASPGRMGYEFMKWLDMVREQCGVPMVITSSYRTPAHNAKVGGARNSAHTDTPCEAVDVGERPRKDDPNWTRSRFLIVSTAILLGCKRIGSYPDGSLHLDMTHSQRPAPAMWRVVGSVAPR